MTHSVDLTADIIDVRDIIARIERLEPLREPGPIDLGVDNESSQDDLFAELAKLEAILSDLEDEGDEEDWRGAWYPITLIRATHFEDFAHELAEDCGMIRDDAQWPYTCIDWQKAARELQMDYTSTEIEGHTYYFR